MKEKQRFVCIGGPFDGASPPWADGRPEIRYPVPPNLTATMDEFMARQPQQMERYLLTQLEDGRIIYMHESLRVRHP